MSEIESSGGVSPWRTVLTGAFVALLQTVAFVYAMHRGFTNEGASAFGSLCTWSTCVALGVAVKALGEHLSNGSGIKGAISALLTSTQPGQPAPNDPKP